MQKKLIYGQTRTYRCQTAEEMSLPDGTGRRSFITSAENGNPIIVYHARDWDDSYPGATDENKYGLTDPGRPNPKGKDIHYRKK